MTLGLVRGAGSPWYCVLVLVCGAWLLLGGRAWTLCVEGDRHPGWLAGGLRPDCALNGGAAMLPLGVGGRHSPVLDVAG